MVPGKARFYATHVTYSREGIHIQAERATLGGWRRHQMYSYVHMQCGGLICPKSWVNLVSLGIAWTRERRERETNKGCFL